MIFLLSLLILALSFLFPIGLYPFQDFIRDFLAFSAVLLIFLSLLQGKILEFGVSRSLGFLLGLFFLLLVSFIVFDPEIVISYNHYLLSIVFVFMLSVSTSTLVHKFSISSVVNFAFLVVFWISFISIILSFLRFYGVLKVVFPVILNDGDRLIGPFGQPNLHALISSFGVLSLVYFRFVKTFINRWAFWALVLPFFYAGALTASRTWMISIVIISLAVLIYALKVNLSGKPFLREHYVTPLLLLILMAVFYGLAPKLDSVLAGPLVESGYINRTSSEEVLAKRLSSGSSGRLAEWKKTVVGFSDIDNLWIGNGLGRYGEFSNRIELKNNISGNGNFWGHSHNIFIMFLIEFGFLGLAYVIFLFLYIGVVFYKSIFCVNGRAEFVFPFSIVFILLAHSLVEFSLWYFPFLFLFVVFFTAMDKFYLFTVSSKFFPRVVAVLFFVIFTPLGIYVAKDVYSVTKIMYEKTSDFSDVWELGYISNSSIIGDKALMVAILRFPPMVSGGEQSLKQLAKYADWRPRPLFLLREASLSAFNLAYEDSCHKIINAIKLYPDIIVPLKREIKLLVDSKDFGENSDSYFDACVMEGVNYWVRNGRKKAALLAVDSAD